jgi:hypothetical protein
MREQIVEKPHDFQNDWIVVVEFLKLDVGGERNAIARPTLPDLEILRVKDDILARNKVGIAVQFINKVRISCETLGFSLASQFPNKLTYLRQIGVRPQQRRFL